MSPRTVGLFLFDRFELLDAAGPIQALGMIPANFQIKLLGPACKFYKKMGCRLGQIKRGSYTDFPEKIELDWYRPI